MQAKFNELSTQSKLSSISYKISSISLMSWVSYTVSSMSRISWGWVRWVGWVELFDELGKLDEFDEMSCKFGELVYRNTWGPLWATYSHTPCPEIYCLRLIDEYCENNAEILCVIVYCIGMCLRQNSGHGVWSTCQDLSRLLRTSLGFIYDLPLMLFGKMHSMIGCDKIRTIMWPSSWIYNLYRKAPFLHTLWK